MMISTSGMISGKNVPIPQPLAPTHGILKNGIPHHLGGHPGHHGLDGRLRMDAQTFLVPPLPLNNSRHEQPGNGMKRKDHRSLLNGERENGRRYDPHLQQQQHSPRSRESLSPYSDMMHHPLMTHQHPPNYHRPTLSPGPAHSPKAHSPQSTKGGSERRSLSPNHDMLNGHYPNGFPHHNLGMQSHHAAFFAAAAAAAGAPYPLFGPPFVPHSHAAAASSYLDTFHNNILAQQQHHLKTSTSTGPVPYLPQYLRLPYQPHTTSTTSLHSDLIESSSERYSHAHQHRNGDMGLATVIGKGGPLGMNPLEPPIHLKKSLLPPSHTHSTVKDSQYDRDHLTYSHLKTSPNNRSPPSDSDLIRAALKQNYVNQVSRGELSSYGRQGQDDPVKTPLKGKTSHIFTFPPEVPLAHRNGHMNRLDPKEDSKTNLGHIQNPFQPPGSSPMKRKPPPLHWNQELSPKSKNGLSSPGFLSLPQSPSYYKVPKSPSVTFKTGPKVPPSPTLKKVLQTHNENQPNRSLLLAPVPVEEMPMIEAFKQGSLIQLASGEVKSVENLCGEDFTHSAAQMVDSVKIIYCKVLAIQEIIPARSSTSTTPYCKVTLGMESHRQQVILDSTLEQPFFVLGRGWSSLSPEMSRRILQLSCSALQVGDVCMTLSRTPTKPKPPSTVVTPATTVTNTKVMTVSATKTTGIRTEVETTSEGTEGQGSSVETGLKVSSVVTNPTAEVQVTTVMLNKEPVPKSPLPTTERNRVTSSSEHESGPPSPKKKRGSNPVEMESQSDVEEKMNDDGTDVEQI